MTQSSPPVIGLVFHRTRPASHALAHDVAQWCAQNGVVVALLPKDSGRIDTASAVVEVVDDFSGVSLVVAIGGDGTMLRAIHAVGAGGVPVVGVNVGYLGYLTRVEPEAVFDVLDSWLRGFAADTVVADERMMVELQVGDNDPVFALNEVVFEKQESGHTVRLHLDVDGSAFTTYVADGLIIASPTGSTAYALSARGPILSPQLRALLVTPVSPHMLFDRSLVLHTNEEVRVTVEGQRGVNVVADGTQVGSLEPGQDACVRCSRVTARLLRVEDQSFHQILRQKFGLADR